MTRDGGGKWEPVSKGLPRKIITRVLASRHAKGVAYTTLSGDGRDEFGAYVYRTDDYGKTWRSIAKGLPAESVYTVVEDPKYADVAYVGTMLGVYVTIDGGRSWASLCEGFPAVPVFDLAVHPRELELVAATHGRSVFVLDLARVHAAADGRRR